MAHGFPSNGNPCDGPEGIDVTEPVSLSKPIRAPLRPYGRGRLMDRETFRSNFLDFPASNITHRIRPDSRSQTRVQIYEYRFDGFVDFHESFWGLQIHDVLTDIAMIGVQVLVAQNRRRDSQDSNR